MNTILTLALSLVAGLTLSAVAFAGPMDANATASAAPAFSASAFSAFTQHKGARSASAVSGAVSAKLLNEYRNPVAGHGTGANLDSKGLAGFIAPAAPKVVGMVGQKVNAALWSGLGGARPK